ncbi:MAG: type IV-A pilus assembly ATPase PilB, partial [Gammaproteobacteria bacterium]|nr:type IV-A pilus assembly ATPase PilB [Gammaproteobacteria bacterium]
MSGVNPANLVGITGIARRLLLDGALDEATAREALDKATAERKPVALWLREKKLVSAAQLTAANSIEFGMPVFDPASMEADQSAIKLVKEDLLHKHGVLPLFKRGPKLFVGTSDPTDTRALDEVKFNANLTVEPILVDEDTLKRTLELWLDASDNFSEALEDADGLEDLDVGDDDAATEAGSDLKGDDTPIVKF